MRSISAYLLSRIPKEVSVSRLAPSNSGLIYSFYSFLTTFDYAIYLPIILLPPIFIGSSYRGLGVTIIYFSSLSSGLELDFFID